MRRAFAQHQLLSHARARACVQHAHKWPMTPFTMNARASRRAHEMLQQHRSTSSRRRLCAQEERAHVHCCRARLECVCARMARRALRACKHSVREPLMLWQQLILPTNWPVLCGRCAVYVQTYRWFLWRASGADSLRQQDRQQQVRVVNTFAAHRRRQQCS